MSIFEQFMKINIKDLYSNYKNFLIENFKDINLPDNYLKKLKSSILNYNFIDNLYNDSGDFIGELCDLEFSYEEDNKKIFYEAKEILILYPDDKGYFYNLNRKMYSPWVIFDGFDFKSDDNKKVMDINKKIILQGYYLAILNYLIGLLNEENKINKKDNYKLYKINKFSEKIGVSVQKLFLKGEQKSEKSYIWKKTPVFFIPNDLNYIENYTNPRKVVYPSDKVSRSLRMQHDSQKYILDYLETPESEKIGLTLSLVDSKYLKYDFKKLNFINSKKDDSAKNLLSFASYQVPFILHSDAVRILMGAKNLKQSLKVIKAELPYISTGKELESIGVNALIAYGLFEGFNFEDGIVVSKSFADKMKVFANEIKKYDIYFKDDKLGMNDFEKSYEEKNNQWKYFLNYKSKSKIIIDWKVSLGSIVSYGDILFRVEKYNDQKKKVESVKYDGRYSAKVIKLPEIIPSYKNKIDFDDFGPMIDFEIVYEVEKPLEVGDKVMGRHGNKGTISKIVDDEIMPKVFIKDKEYTLDMLLSPLGVVSRMNIGQLYEVHSSMAQIHSDFCEFEKCVSPFVNGYSYKEKIINSLVKIGSDSYGRFKVKYKNFNWNLVSGYQYFVRLDHCVRDKIHFVNKAEISRFTNQPYKGKSNNGGQKFGEMEFWCLYGYNNTELINLFSNNNSIKNKKNSDDILKLLLKEFGISLELKNNISKWSLSNVELLDEDKIDINSYIKVNDKNDFKNKMNKFIKEKNKVDIKKSKYYKNLFKKLFFKKEGFIRSFILSHRLHNSGRTVITPQPKLNMNTYTGQDIELTIDDVILPIEFGLEMIKNDNEKLNVKNIKNGLQGDYKKRIEIAKKLNEIFNDNKKMVILNRQPSLFRQSMQSFYPKFWSNYTIGLPIFVCESFNADFDGDTMAVYYPTVQNEKIYCELNKMLPSNNPFKLGDGSLSYSIDQDIVYGAYIDKNFNKKEIKSEIVKELSEAKRDDSVSDYVKEKLHKYLNIATEKNLTLSIYEIEDNKSENSLKYIEDSGCRGKKSQFEQLYDKIEGISKDNFLKGISVEDYFKEGGLSSRARRSLMDKKLGVADAGYFTRKLVELLGNIYIGDFDDYEEFNLEMGKKFSIYDFLNRYIKIDDEIIKLTEDNIDKYKNFKELVILSPKIIETSSNVFEISKKYLGNDLSTLNEFEVGEYIGVFTGHLLGERGTQLSMETFHAGDSSLPIITISNKAFSYNFEENNNSYMKFIDNFFDIEGIDILSKFDINSIYFEILYSFTKLLSKKESLKNNKLYKSVKDYFSDYLYRGPFTTMSFESGYGVLTDIDFDKKYTETSFRNFYVIGGDDDR
ncbi:MAG: DNA-directed polymerase subunit beta [Oceanotoga sp.]|uniref:hypothetical protein n=1 Tax=Oceanotoga sp. TaxID=2108366 RepID=UPI00264B2E3D|nr:hypothetical protein [Oceanotoga sp.]MDN5342257.1 DNA-directed polymerase subunit beta [Oceanotoga sp.]